MFSFSARAGRVLLALNLAVLTACVDDHDVVEPERKTISQPQFGLGDVYTVTNANDHGLGSLRWALEHTTGGEFIRFDPSLAGQTITVDSTLQVRYPVAIEGPSGQGITISGGDKVRVFFIVNYGNVTMRNLSITGGNSSSYPAGAIRSYSGGDLTLEHVLIYGNKGGGPSSAIEGNGQVLLENSTVSGNVTTETNPTIATAAVYAYGNMILNNSTVTNNVGGGLRGTGPNSITLRNSIISNNGSGINCSALVTMIYTGRNISDDDSCGGPADMLIGNPLLAPLADNGGPTRTHALQTGSLAINAGTSCTVAVDQRYVARDTACDLGAFEFIDFTTVELAPSASVSVSKSDRWAVVTGTVRCSRGETFEVAVDLEQSQRAGTVKASGTTAVTCSTASQPWSVALAPASGSFEVGSGKASVRTANTAAWVTPASTANTVKFFWARK